jgi:GAF domain-containing protein/HAMP domain-containing protein
MLTSPFPAASSSAIHARRALLIMLGGIVTYDSVSWYLAVVQGAWQLYAVAGIVLAYGLFALAGLWLAGRGRGGQGVALTIGAFVATLLAINSLIRNLGLSMAVIGPILTIALAAGNLGRRGLLLALLAALLGGLAGIALDLGLFGALPYRLSSPALESATPAIAAILAVVFVVSLLRLLADFSLRVKLIVAFLAVALIPLAVLAALNFRASSQALSAAANDALRGAAAQTALSLDTFFDNTRGIVQGEAQQPAISAYFALPPEVRAGSPEESALRAAMAIWQRRDTRARAYMLLDASGVVIQATTSLDLGAEHGDKGFFLEAMRTGQSHLSALRLEPDAELGDIYFSIVINQPNGVAPVGVLVARFSARVVQDIIEDTTGLAGANSFGVVVDENLMYVAHGLDPAAVYRLVGPATPDQISTLQAQYRLPNRRNFVYSTDHAELAASLAQAGAQPFFSAADLAAGGRRNQVAVVPLESYPWQVAFFQPQDVFLAPVRQQTQATVTLAAIIALIVTAVAVAAAQVLADPIARLTSTAEKVAAGDLTAQAEVASRDEIGLLARTFNELTARLTEQVGTLEHRVTERTAQLQAAADISRATASVRNLDDLLRLALDLIRDRFGYYHASIFLLDSPGDYAVLRESTGPVGAQLKARGHRLAVGSQSLIGWITANRQPRVALDVAEDPFHFRNPLLPDTRSELAIPLVAGDRLLGALDVQSREPNAFSPGSIQVLQTLADQLSVAIENAELFQRTQASLEELGSLYQRLAGGSWRGYLRGRQREAVFEAVPGEATLITTSAEPLQVPLKLRDRIVGSIELHGRRAEDWTAEERAAIGTIAAQVTAALESAALLEETQRRRLREQMINEITYQMRATLNSTSVVQSGMRELGRALGATEVVVRFAPETGSPPEGEP